MKSNELREKYLSFFEKRGHVVVPSSSLVSDDPTVLLTTAGMQQFKPHYTGERDPVEDFGSKNTASVQKSFRTSDIDEVGDESHLTFFEMLGNFSFGGYFKKEAIEYAHEFVTKELGLEIDYVTIFGGSDEVPRDSESERAWKAIGITDIREAGMEDNFWGPTGAEGPCGPTTEIYVNGVEIWNLVFNEYYCAAGGKLTKLETPGVDTGMGLERLAMVVQKVSSIYETDLFAPILELLPGEIPERDKRIIADHVRAACFLVPDGVRPENKGAGYVLRRLLRRSVALGPEINFNSLIKAVVREYGGFYKELSVRTITEVWAEEREKFEQTFERGKREIEKLGSIDAKTAFGLFASHGISYEAIKDMAGSKAAGLTREEFEKEFAKHQEISRAGAGQKFAGGLTDHEPETVRLHTATHLLNAALRKVLGEHVFQRGQNITTKRSRFDFSHGEKMTDEQLAEAERLVNEWISHDLPVRREEMSQERAVKLGAIGVFGEKYPERVSVYTIEDPGTGEVISREFCGGPHVSHTGELGVFSIKKEESSSAGVRRIRAFLA